MAATNGTILNLFTRAPCWAGAPLFALLFPNARNATSRSQSSRTTSQLNTGSPLPRFSSKSHFRKGGFRGILAIRRTPLREAGAFINRLISFLTFRHAEPWIKSRAGFEPASRNRLHFGLRWNDGLLDNLKLWHVLPAGFHKVRHYGFLPNGRSKTNLARIREALESKPESEEQRVSDEMKGVLCPICRIGRLAPAFIIDRFGQMIIRNLSLLKAGLVFAT